LRRLAATDHNAGNETANECERRTKRAADIGNQAIACRLEFPQIEVRA